jgi:hypothetical protein
MAKHRGAHPEVRPISFSNEELLAMAFPECNTGYVYIGVIRVPFSRRVTIAVVDSGGVDLGRRTIKLSGKHRPPQLAS